MVDPVPLRSIGASTDGGDNQVPDDMNTRIVKLEVAVKGLRDSVNIVLAVVGLLMLVLLYGISRIDTLNDRVNALPGQISGDLRDITKTLAESITAAKQQTPQVILMPAPVQQAPVAPAPATPQK